MDMEKAAASVPLPASLAVSAGQGDRRHIATAGSVTGQNNSLQP